MYRRWIAALLPDLLKGTFNHHARTEVCRLRCSMLTSSAGSIALELCPLV